MSDYTVVSFELVSTDKLQAIRKHMKEIFDAHSIKPTAVEGRYELTISELNLKECLSILDGLGSKFNLSFLVEYGVYE